MDGATRAVCKEALDVGEAETMTAVPLSHRVTSKPFLPSLSARGKRGY